MFWTGAFHKQKRLVALHNLKTANGEEVGSGRGWKNTTCSSDKVVFNERSMAMKWVPYYLQDAHHIRI